MSERIDLSSLTAADAVAVTKSDTTPVAFVGLYIGGTGDVAVKGLHSPVAVTFVAVPAGTILPINVTRVMSAGTTATSIVGFVAP